MKREEALIEAKKLVEKFEITADELRINRRFDCVASSDGKHDIQKCGMDFKCFKCGEWNPSER